MVMMLDMAGIGISFGSACTSGMAKASAILLDMGITKEDALSTVRISFGKIHSFEDIKTVIDAIQQILDQHSNKIIVHER